MAIQKCQKYDRGFLSTKKRKVIGALLSHQKTFSFGLDLCAFAPLREIFFAVIMMSLTDRSRTEPRLFA
jgi:hypothetical protein